LAPDFKTIARFRKDNGKAIRCVCRQFVMLCQRLDLFAEALVAIDGSKFKAVNHRDRYFTSAKLERRMRDIEASINRYLVQMDTADRQEPTIARAKTERLQDKIAALKEQMKILTQVEVQLDAAPDKQVSLTDPDARSMKTRGTGVVGGLFQVIGLVAYPTTDRRASVRHDQGLDGSHSFPNAHYRASEHGDEPARARLQHEAGNQGARFRNGYEGDAGVKIARRTGPRIRSALTYVCRAAINEPRSVVAAACRQIPGGYAF
jgi:hypothetical protein